MRKHQVAGEILIQRRIGRSDSEITKLGLRLRP